MGTFSDTLKEYNLSPELVSAMGTAESIYGTVSGAYAVYGGAHELGEKLGFWSGDETGFDRLEKAIAKIAMALHAGFAAVLEGQELQGQQAKIDNLLILKSEALGALSLLKTVPPGGSLTPNQIDLLTTNTNCDVYGDWSGWDLPYYQQSAHTDAWSKRLEPPHNGSVKAFAVVLPRYLQAIALRLVALAAAYKRPFRKPEPGEAAFYYAELMAHTDMLVKVHDTVRAAIVPLALPTAAEMLAGLQPPPSSTTAMRYWTLSPSAWERGKRLYGAVELYSTTDSIFTYPDPEPAPPKPADFPVEPTVPEYVPPPNPNAPDYSPPVSHYNDYKTAFDTYAANFKAHYYPVFAARHAVMSLREQKAVYNGVGLGHLWSAMNRLRSIAGEPPLTVSDPGPGLSTPDAAWSLQEAHQRIAVAVGSVPVGTIMMPVASFPVTIRALGPLVGIPSAAVGSLRQVLLDESGRVP